MTSAAVYLHSTGMMPSMWSNAPRPHGRVDESVTPGNLGYPPASPVTRPAETNVADDVSHALTQIPASGPVHLVGHFY